ncbi:ergosterol biosynthetic protein 28 homolog isoform X2 [Phyllobates terribilis]|uniref:ergosterol biosynthetic protein 28 homolog isoform X2 n=1 Tax=Phyllobates terribilis TaxID=111132 RepID=UPI003CCA850E
MMTVNNVQITDTATQITRGHTRGFSFLLRLLTVVFGMSRFLAVLRSWLMMVAIIAAGNTLQSFRDHSFLSDKLYTGQPGQVNGLQARTFGIWTLLSSVIRCACAIDIRNKMLYHITLWTFIMALAHFLSEVWVYHTAQMTIGVMAPLLVASFSIMGMVIGYQYLELLPEPPSSSTKKRN